jgi:hypothetical protein
VEGVVNPRVLLIGALVLMPASAWAQTTPSTRGLKTPGSVDPAEARSLINMEAGSLDPATQQTDFSRLWIVGGAGSMSFLADCEECGDPEDYQHSYGLLVNAGRAVTRRIDVGGELVWTPGETAAGDPVRTTFVLAATQFRPWQSHGFFVKGGIGIAFIKNRVTIEQDSGEFITKSLAVAIGGGWEWRLRGRVGAQIYASQHVAAAGDILTSIGAANNVMVNFWSLGGAVVIR